MDGPEIDLAAMLADADAAKAVRQPPRGLHPYDYDRAYDAAFREMRKAEVRCPLHVVALVAEVERLRAALRIARVTPGEPL